jgi:hypothetical protein
VRCDPEKGYQVAPKHCFGSSEQQHSLESCRWAKALRAKSSPGGHDTRRGKATRPRRHGERWLRGRVHYCQRSPRCRRIIGSMGGRLLPLCMLGANGRQLYSWERAFARHVSPVTSAPTVRVEKGRLSARMLLIVLIFLLFYYVRCFRCRLFPWNHPGVQVLAHRLTSESKGRSKRY